MIAVLLWPAAWMNIMRDLPAATLVLIEADDYIKNNLLLEAAFAGVHSSRILFWEKVEKVFY